MKGKLIVIDIRNNRYHMFNYWFNYICLGAEGQDTGRGNGKGDI